MTVEEASTFDYLNRMGRGSKLFHRNKVTVFEEIHEVDSVEKKEVSQIDDEGGPNKAQQMH